MATVELRNITKIYEGGVKAVDSANLTINDKEFVVLVGPSGCGKTTTLGWSRAWRRSPAESCTSTGSS